MLSIMKTMKAWVGMKATRGRSEGTWNSDVKWHGGIDLEYIGGPIVGWSRRCLMSGRLRGEHYLKYLMPNVYRSGR